MKLHAVDDGNFHGEYGSTTYGCVTNSLTSNISNHDQ